MKPKKWLCPVFSRYWVVGWILNFKNLFAMSLPFSRNVENLGGRPKFCEKGGDNMVNDFDKKKVVHIHINLSIHLFLLILKH